MPDIKGTYSAPGGGTQATLVITSSVGSAHLTATTAAWTTASVGDIIIVEGIDTQSDGGILFLGKINGIDGDKMGVTLSGPATIEVIGSSQLVTWGPNNLTAFLDWKAANQGSTLNTLTFPDSDVYMVFNDTVTNIAENSYIARGVLNYIWDGQGHSPLIAGQFRFGTLANPQQAITFPVSARTAAVARGATGVQLLTAGQYTRFVPGNEYTLSNEQVYRAGTTAIMQCLEMQGPVSAPQNPYFWEYVTITDAPASGAISFAAPLVNAYGTNYRDFTSGDALDVAGPATLFMLDAKWDARTVFKGMRFYHPSGLCYAQQRYVASTEGSVWLGQYGLCGSINEDYILDATSVPNALTEMDKLVWRCTIRNGSTVRIPWFQSASVENLLIEYSTVTERLKGTPKHAVLRNSTIAALQLGPDAYGITESIYASGNIISELDPTRPVYDADITDPTGQTQFALSNGIMSIIGGTGVGGPCVRWGIPGALIHFRAQKYSETAFRVTSCNPDGSVNTSMYRISAYPNVPLSGSTDLGVQAAPYLVGTFENNTGCDDIVDLSQIDARGKLFGEYSRRTYQRNPTGTQIAINAVPIGGPILYGQLRSITVGVSVAFTTAGALAMHVLGRFFANAIDLPPASSSLTSWLPIVDLKTIGTRAWNFGDGSWSGVVGADSLAIPTGGNVWLCDIEAPYISATVTDGDPGVVTVTLVTDQYPDIAPPIMLYGNPVNKQKQPSPVRSVRVRSF